MKIKEILKYSKKPDIYELGTSVMWTDEHISEQLLNIHLNPQIDLGSRKKTSIKKTLNWILKITGNIPLSILDLGCGPGLYSEFLAKKGHKVTGVDFSKNSIEYARKQASEKKLDIKYLNLNYLNLNLEDNQFDAVLLIYTDFGVLQPKERKQLLKIVKKVLKPGGMFIFDVLNDKEFKKKTTPKTWEIAHQGFWKNTPYISFSESFFYPENKVILYQHIVTDEKDKVEVYRFWTHFFSHSELQKELNKSGFYKISFHTDILPEGDLWNGENVTFCAATNTK